MYEHITVFPQQRMLEILVFMVFSVFFSTLLYMILVFMDEFYCKCVESIL